MPRDRWDEQQDRQRYANWRVQTLRREYGGALTFAALLRHFRHAGNEFDTGSRLPVDEAPAEVAA